MPDSRSLSDLPTARLASVGAIDELVERVRSVVEHAVDHYEIAATLESQGITDPIAFDRYGCVDVFALARAVEARGLAAQQDRDGPNRHPAAVRGPWRDVTHSLLYLLPASAFPVGVALLHRPSLLNGILMVGGVGWLWSGVAAWLAWQFLGSQRPVMAARLLRFAALLALPVALAVCFLMGPPNVDITGLLVVGVTQMAFQVSSMLFMFYRREEFLFLALTPGVLVAVAFFVVGPSILPLAAGVVGGSVALAFLVGLWQTRVRGEGKESLGHREIERLLPQIAVVACHTALSAIFLLHAQSLFLRGNIAVLVAFLPLMVGMGIVEWRARRFAERSRELLAVTSQASRFESGLRRMLGYDVIVCAGAVAIASGLLLGGLAVVGQLHPAAVVLCVTSVVLGPAYFAALLLTNAGRSLWLCIAFGGAAGLQFACVRLEVWEPTPVGNALAVLSSCVLLLALFAAALGLIFREARNFR
jgi:hypothetical protein